MNTLSVIMATYNENRGFLQNCIQSVLNQTYGDFEFLIVIEPGESNRDYLNHVSVADNRIRIIGNTSRLGVAASRNRAIMESRGQYVALIDGDDYCDVRRFVIQQKQYFRVQICGWFTNWYHNKFHEVRRSDPMMRSLFFVEQLKNFMTRDDLIIGISVSGNSKNVLRAVEYANDNAAKTFGICGFGGGKLGDVAQKALIINSTDKQKVEDIHMIILHCAMQWLNLSGRIPHSAITFRKSYE